MIPDMVQDQTELERLQEAMATRQSILSVPSFRQTPISEWANQCILRMAFPTLFPQGLGDPNLERPHEIKYIDWIKHVLRLKDGRFARHPRFRYMVFNILLRSQSKSMQVTCGGRLMAEELALKGSGRMSSQATPNSLTISCVRPNSFEERDRSGTARGVSSRPW